MRRKRQILRAASEAFAARGFHRTGMRDIAALLGMTAGNLYYYFENKEALLAFCQEETAHRLLELATWVEMQPVGADVKLALLIIGHVRCLHEGVPGSLAHLQVDLLGERWRRSVVEVRDRYDVALRKLLRRGRERGVFRADLDDKLAALAILGAANGSAAWFRPGGPQTATEVGVSFARLLVSGVVAGELTFAPEELEVPVFGAEEDRAVEGESGAGA